MLPDFNPVGIRKLSRTDSRKRTGNAVSAKAQHFIHKPFSAVSAVGNETVGLFTV